MKIFEVFGFIFKFGPLLARFGPLLLKLVRVVEKLLSDAPGEDKKRVAMEALRLLLESLKLPARDSLMKAFGHFIDMLVALLHARGEFRHQSAPKSVSVANVQEAAVRVAKAVSPNDARLDELEAKLERSVR